MSRKQLCDLRFSPEDIQTLKDAVDREYYFEFFIDEFSFGGFVGRTEETNLIPHTHRNFLYTALSLTIYNDGATVSD